MTPSWLRVWLSAALCAMLLGCSSPDSVAPDSVPSTAAQAVALPWPSLPSTPVPHNRTSRLQAELTRWVDSEIFPGVTAAVASPQGVWSGAAGVDGGGVLLQAHSGMALGSVGKTFTAAELMLLAERGTVDLDEPATTYLPVPLLSNGVTVRQLLGHRSGIQDPRQERYTELFRTPDEHWTPQQFLEPVPVPTQSPGQAWRYENVNYTLLGMLVERVMGASTATVLSRDLFQPLGIDRLAYQDEQSLPPPLATAGWQDEQPISASSATYLPYRSIASAPGGAGVIAGDAPSVARWGYSLYGALLLRPDSVKQMTNFDDGDGYGLGTFDYTAPLNAHHRIEGFGHPGVAPGYRAVLAVYPANALCVVILTPSSVDPLPYVRDLAKAATFNDGKE